MLNKTVSLKDIDFKAKAINDLPYLKKKACECLDRYSKETDIEKKKEYIKLHFTYMSWYHGTLDAIKKDKCLIELFEEEMLDAIQSGDLEIVDRLLFHWTHFVKDLEKSND